MKNRILENLENWHEKDFMFLMDAIQNSELKRPYSMGQGKAINEFKQFLNKVK